MTLTGCPVTARMYQHVVLVLHICRAIDVKRLQGCELGFTVMNQPASASLWINLSCVNERCFCLLPSKTKLYPWFLYLLSCLNRHWKGRSVCMSLYFSQSKKERIFLFFFEGGKLQRSASSAPVNGFILHSWPHALI